MPSISSSSRRAAPCLVIGKKMDPSRCSAGSTAGCRLRPTNRHGPAVGATRRRHTHGRSRACPRSPRADRASPNRDADRHGRGGPVEKGQGQNRGGKAAPNQGCSGGAPSPGAIEKQCASRQFYQRVAQADGCCAGGTFTPQKKITQNRNVFIPADLMVTLEAAGAWHHQVKGFCGR